MSHSLLGPIVVGRREADNCAIIFSKLGLSFVRPEASVSFRHPKRYLKWVCLEVFGLELKYFNFTSVRLCTFSGEELGPCLMAFSSLGLVQSERSL